MAQHPGSEPADGNLSRHEWLRRRLVAGYNSAMLYGTIGVQLAVTLAGMAWVWHSRRQGDPTRAAIQAGIVALLVSGAAFALYFGLVHGAVGAPPEERLMGLGFVGAKWTVAAAIFAEAVLVATWRWSLRGENAR